MVIPAMSYFYTSIFLFYIIMIETAKPSLLLQKHAYKSNVH